MTHPRDGAAKNAARLAGPGIALALTLLIVLAAVSVSTGLVVYTALRHDLLDGLFALAFAVLSARALLSWFLWRESDETEHEGRQLADAKNL